MERTARFAAQLAETLGDGFACRAVPSGGAKPPWPAVVDREGVVARGFLDGAPPTDARLRMLLTGAAAGGAAAAAGVAGAAGTPSFAIDVYRGATSPWAWAHEALGVGKAEGSGVAVLYKAQDNRLSACWAVLETDGLAANDKATEEDMLVSPAFTVLFDIARAAGLAGKVATHFNNYAKIETWG